MLRVGLTGGIGSGKSAVSGRLAALGAVVLDADKAARVVVEPGTPGLAQIADTFGPGVLAPDGSLDRAKLAEIVFADKTALAKLNAITHPLIHEHIRAAEEAAIQASGGDLVLVHDVALLAEWGRSKEFDLVIVVDVPPELQVERLIQQRGMSEDQARARMAAQATRDQRLAIADIIIDNSGTLADLDRHIAAIWSTLQSRANPQGELCELIHAAVRQVSRRAGVVWQRSALLAVICTDGERPKIADRSVHPGVQIYPLSLPTHQPRARRALGTRRGDSVRWPKW